MKEYVYIYVYIFFQIIREHQLWRENYNKYNMTGKKSEINAQTR